MLKKAKGKLKAASKKVKKISKQLKEAEGKKAVALEQSRKRACKKASEAREDVKAIENEIAAVEAQLG